MSLPFGRIKHLLIDLDGVLYRGETALPCAADFVAWLHGRGITFRLVTNNATLTPTQYVEKLARMGISAGEDEIFTSALATGMYLKEHGNGGDTAYVIGEDGLRSAVEAAGFRIVDEKPDWVVVGLDRRLTYEKLATAALSLEAGARFVGSNPDTSFPTECGLVPGAGAILRAIQATTGVDPLVIGKPQPLMLEMAMRSLGGSRNDTAMLGDRLDTDIQAAEAVGVPSVLVLTGVSTRADLEHSSIRPTLVVQDLCRLMEQWGGQE